MRKSTSGYAVLFLDDFLLTCLVPVQSLGCVLFALAYLHSPFENTQTTEQGGSIAMAVLNAQYKHPTSNYSQGVKVLIDSMLKINPQERPDIQQVLLFPHGPPTSLALTSLSDTWRNGTPAPICMIVKRIWLSILLSFFSDIFRSDISTWTSACNNNSYTTVAPPSGCGYPCPFSLAYYSPFQVTQCLRLEHDMSA